MLAQSRFGGAGAKRKFWLPPSGLNPHATASASTTVDLPEPFSPTRNVTPGGRSSPGAWASHATAGSVNG